MIKTAIERVLGVAQKRRIVADGKSGQRQARKGDEKPEPSAREKFTSAKDAGEQRPKGTKRKN